MRGQSLSSPIGRTSFQKLACFATEVGIPTKLNYQKGSYGPFLQGLKKIIARLEYNGLIREERHGNMLHVRPGPACQDALRVFKPALQDLAEQLGKVADLFLRMNTRRAEVAATVHFAAHHLLKDGEDAS